jgi:hypothetical protein
MVPSLSYGSKPAEAGARYKLVDPARLRDKLVPAHFFAPFDAPFMRGASSRCHAKSASGL